MLSPAASAPAADLLQAVLDVSLTGIIVFRPVYDPADPATITDLAYVHLNPAAQRMLQLPECPSESFLTRYPSAVDAGIFAFYRDTFLAGEPGRYDVNYQADGLDNYYHLASRRAGDRLVVSFTDTADQPRSAVELALRESQARAREARAEVERQRQELQRLFEQAPVALAVFDGPDYVVQLANPDVLRLWGRTREQALQTPLFELLPEAAGQGFEELLDGVMTTGVPYVAHELPSFIDRHGRRDTVYWNFVYQPLRQQDGRITGVTVVASEVTEQVRARQQLEQLNQELETRVQQRAREAETARAEAEEQRNRLLRLFGQAPAQINLFAGPDHVWTLVHPRTQELLPNRALLGLPHRRALPELPEENHEPFDRVYRTGEPVHVLESIRRLDRSRDGELHDEYFDLTIQPLFDAAGQIEGVMSFAVTVTERVGARQQAEVLQAEVLAAAQRQAQEREAFRNVFEQTPALIALLRAPEHLFEYVNPAYQQLFPGRQLVGLAMGAAVPEAREQGFVALLDRVYETGETFSGAELLFAPVPAEGQPALPRYYNFTYQAYREAGEIAGVTIFAYDVTEQVLARQQREAERQQLQDLFEQAPVAIGILRGADYVVEVANPLVARLWGRTPADVLGRPVFEALPEARDQGFKELLDGVRQSGKAFVAEGVPAQLLRGDSIRTVYLNYVYQPLRDADGTITRVAAVGTDVTAQVQDRQRVQELNEELQAANKELGNSNEQLTRTNVDLDNFIYTASHDLKAPISNIEGLLYLLQEELPAEVAQDAEVGPTLTRMLEAVERFKRTLDHLTEVSKLQKEHAPAATPVNLANVVEDVRQDLLPLLQGAGAKLFIDVSVLPPVQFSEKNLRSIVYNLLSNAVKYRHPDRTPHVDVRAHVRAGHTVLEVHDNGLGIDANHLPRLFTMFQRFHDHVEGTGIGLYMVKRMVENAGGRIEVHSQLGAGTTFFVFLPHTTSPAGHPFPAFLAS